MEARSEIGDATFSNRLSMACLNLQRPTLKEVGTVFPVWDPQVCMTLQSSAMEKESAAHPACLPSACLNLQRKALVEVDATFSPGSAESSSPVESNHRRGKCSCPGMAS